MRNSVLWAICLLTIVSMFIAVFIFTRSAFCNYFYLDESTGFIGDTIGGITSPIVGLASIILLCYTLKKQQEFEQRQLAQMREEKFEATLFNLLAQQRAIRNELVESFHTLSKNNVCKKIDGKAQGLDFFAMARYELYWLFRAFNDGATYNDYNETGAEAYMQSIYDEISYGPSHSEGITKEDKKILDNAKHDVMNSFYANMFNITESDIKIYNQKSDFEKVKYVYSKYYLHRQDSGHYFRHLYRILSFIEQSEEKEMRFNQNVAQIRKNYTQYAQFIQSQMTRNEMLLLFYNIFCFPKALKLVERYGILENLRLDYLLFPEHNCIPQIKLKQGLKEQQMSSFH